MFKLHAIACMLAVRATLAFLALPVVIAGAVPFTVVYVGSAAPRMPVAGGLVISAGVALLVWCVRDFLVTGRGTLAPWDPPKRLVVVGLYRFVRNPMYIAVLFIVAGWALLFSSWWLVLYWLTLAPAFHARVMLGEEPWLKRQFGEDWEAYARVTGRWFPKFTHGGERKHERQRGDS